MEGNHEARSRNRPGCELGSSGQARPLAATLERHVAATGPVASWMDSAALGGYDQGMIRSATERSTQCHSPWFTPRGTQTDAEYKEYLRLLCRILLNQGINVADVPRAEEPGAKQRWLYVWQSKEEAQDFATRLGEHTRCADWVVTPVKKPVSQGPLRPLEIQVGRNYHRWSFALAPWARKAIQTLFPDSCQSSTVTIASQGCVEFQTDQGKLDRLSQQMLLILTGLSTERLVAFKSYVVTDPVSGEIVLAPRSIHSGDGVCCP